MNVKKYDVGKRVGHVWYFHKNYLPSRVQATIRRDWSHIKGWNIVKVDQYDDFSFLKYRRFMSDDFPELEWSIKTCKGSVEKPKKITYCTDNPPIFHRKELLFPDDHPCIPKARAMTRKCEDAGLFKDTKRIGRKKQWQTLLNSL